MRTGFQKLCCFCYLKVLNQGESSTEFSKNGIQIFLFSLQESDLFVLFTGIGRIAQRIYFAKEFCEEIGGRIKGQLWLYGLDIFSRIRMM
jgi:hypothetical protein